MEYADIRLSEQDRQVYELAGYGKHLPFGARPAVLVIDATYEFTGEVREPILDAVKKIHTACGQEAWNAVDQTVPVLAAARKAGVPVLYTKMDRSGSNHPYANKNQRSAESGRYNRNLYEIVEELAPEEGDVVIPKLSPSAFQGTNLLYHLIHQGIDTLIFAGGTTSGCIRASVTDAFALGFKVGIAADCVFDRWQISHAVSLFDLNAKYANVISGAQVVQYLESLAPRA